MSYLSFIRKETKPHIDSIKQNYIDSKDKELFRASGLTVYCGWQGSGKTQPLSTFIILWFATLNQF